MSSCTQKKADSKINLDNQIMWALGQEDDTVQNACDYVYKTLKPGFCNLSDILGLKECYVWIKIPFKITDDLTDKNLGFVIPYVHFAEKTWVNGVFVGQAGEFGKDVSSSLYASYCYFIPSSIIRQKEENVIYMKILSLGRSSISEGLSLDTYKNAKRSASILNFLHSKIYMTFAGVLLSAFVILLILYFANKKDYAVLNFSLTCLITSFLLSYFYASELPGYGSGVIDHLVFTKVILCISFYLSVFSLVAFMLAFIQIRQPVWFIVFKHTVLYITIIITLAAPDYYALMALCKTMIVVYAAHFLLADFFVFRALFIKDTRYRAIIMLIAFFPMKVAMVMDVIVRNVMRNINYPYFAIFGWIITITFFVVYLSIQYNRIYIQNYKLNRDLQAEVNKQTIVLTDANERLKFELDRASADLNMASIVQQKFFTKPENDFTGWDLALAYSPLSKVSGDFYDFYADNKKLKGFAIFDASGHGTAAALVTMLSKNIVQHAFNKSLTKKRPLNKAMEEVNDNFIKEKGDVENYLTGLLLRFTDSPAGQCKVEMAAAGHPYPVLYSAQNDKLVNLKENVTGNHYGAVGLSDMKVDYADLTFSMSKDDLLVCFTDGLTEIKNEFGEEFDRERVEKIISENHNLEPEKIIEKLEEKTRIFRGKKALEDDISVIILKKK